jgi:hypothetical protein
MFAPEQKILTNEYGMYQFEATDLQSLISDR